MTNVFKDVMKFHKVFKCRIGKKAELPSMEERELRGKLLTEEFKEYINAEYNNDLENIAKELCDIIYIVCGTAISYGIPLEKVFDAVQASNMSKLGEDGKPLFREDRKVMKGPNYKPPEEEIKIILTEAAK